MGLLVHDVGGYSDDAPCRSKLAGLDRLRTMRALEKNMLITIEPGIYFIDFIIKEALKDPIKSKWLCQEKIEEYSYVGGVRIEDDVLVTEDGIEDLTAVPRIVKDIEQWMKFGHKN